MKSLPVFALLLASLAGCDGKGQGPVGGESLAVTRGELELNLLLTGELEADSSVVLSAPRTENFELTVRWIAEDGAIVKAGERLVEFDDSALQNSIGDREIEVIQAGNELANLRARQAVDIAEKHFAAEQAGVEVDKAQVDASLPVEILSKMKYSEYQLALGRAQMKRDAARVDDELTSRGAGLERDVQRLTYDKARRNYDAARDELDSLTLSAPQAGVMIRPINPFEGRKLQVGDKVFPGFTVAKLPNLSKMVVRAVLSDVDDGRVHAGMKVDCVLDAYPGRVFPGLVRSVNPVAREPERNSSRRFFSVVIELDETDEAIMRPGLSVKASVQGGTKADVLLVPRAALHLAGGEARAFDDAGEAHEVELGLCNAQFCELLGGLDEGESLGRVPPQLSGASGREASP